MRSSLSQEVFPTTPTSPLPTDKCTIIKCIYISKSSVPGIAVASILWLVIAHTPGKYVLKLSGPSSGFGLDLIIQWLPRSPTEQKVQSYFLLISPGSFQGRSCAVHFLVQQPQLGKLCLKFLEPQLVTGREMHQVNIKVKADFLSLFPQDGTSKSLTKVRTTSYTLWK